MDSSPSSVQALALCLLLNVDWESGSLDRMVEHFERCLLAASATHAMQGEVHALFGQLMVALDPARALIELEAAERLLASEDRPEGLARVSFHRFWAEALVGCEPRQELLRRGLELEGEPWHPIPSLWFTCIDDFDAARARHDAEDAWLSERGDDRTRGDRAAYRAVVELRAGHWDAAEQYVEAGCNLVESLDAGRTHAVAFGWRSLVDAHRGRIDRARSTLTLLLAAAERVSARSWWVERLLAILAFVEFSAGRYEAADAALTEMQRRYDALGVAEPLLDWSEPFHAEALVALGELARAHEVLAKLEQRGRRFPRFWIDATLPRARALVLAAEDDPQAALSALDGLDLAAASRLPFELAWSLLVKGQLLRRTKQRRAAAAALREALDIFEALGAPAWADRTRAELARVGPRRRASDDLTATERLVAELAATGLTNREVAKAAFVSTKTVEANLARVYRKLGIRSRAELGARIGERPRADR